MRESITNMSEINERKEWMKIKDTKKIIPRRISSASSVSDSLNVKTNEAQLL
jgi:hypothetical protein